MQAAITMVQKQLCRLLAQFLFVKWLESASHWKSLRPDSEFSFPGVNGQKVKLLQILAEFTEI